MGSLASESTMKQVHAKSTVKIPSNVTVELKSRMIKVTGPRGVLTKSFEHMSVDMFIDADNSSLIRVEKWFAASKELAVIKTTCSHVQNMIDGVTKGFEYHMKLVYAHFPTNVIIGKGGKSVEIVNFFVECLEGVIVERDPQNNQELIFRGNNIDNVSRTCALINQECAIKKKDIRKFLDGIYVSSK